MTHSEAGSEAGAKAGAKPDRGSNVGHDYRVTWAMRPFHYGANPAKWTEAKHVDRAQAQAQYDGLKEMEAPEDCAGYQGIGHCDLHVWDITIESRQTGPWERIGR
jgi:hypothetical protein